MEGLTIGTARAAAGDGDVPPGNGGAPNGPRRDAPFNRWFRYPAGFADDLTSALLEALPSKPGLVVDPFLGAATLAPELWGRGHKLAGVEANPLIARVAALKLHDWPTPDKLRAAASSVVATARPIWEAAPIGDEHAVVKKCFSVEALQALATIRNLLQDHSSCREWLVVALAATLRDVSSSSVGWPYQRPNKTSAARHGDPFARFETRVSWMADDIESVTRGGRQGRAIAGDSRSATDLLNAAGDVAQASVTSPPYLNNYDYADATRLELYFLGLADSWSSMCRYARDGMVVASTQQTSKARADDIEQSVLDSAIGDRTASILVDLRLEMEKRERPKEYDRLLLEYLWDMRMVLANLGNVLEKGAPVALAIADSALYGVHIPTPELLSGLAEEVGFSASACTMHRKRGGRWAKNPQRDHDIQLGEYVTKFTRDAGPIVEQPVSEDDAAAA